MPFSKILTPVLNIILLLLVALLLVVGSWLFATAAPAQNAWPFTCAPAIVTGTALNPGRIVGLNAMGMPKSFMNLNGSALMWGCRMPDGSVLPNEIHATAEWLSESNVNKMRAGASAPLETFNKNVTSRSCFTPGATYATPMERNLCKTLRASWVKWALK